MTLRKRIRVILLAVFLVGSLGTVAYAQSGMFNHYEHHPYHEMHQYPDEEQSGYTEDYLSETSWHCHGPMNRGEVYKHHRHHQYYGPHHFNK